MPSEALDGLTLRKTSALPFIPTWKNCAPGLSASFTIMAPKSNIRDSKLFRQ